MLSETHNPRAQLCWEAATIMEMDESVAIFPSVSY